MLTMLAAYREEYEATPGLTIDELLAKYNITTKDIKGYTKWRKREVVSVDKKAPTIAKPVEKKTAQENIEDFKELALDHALKFMRDDARFSEIKEFKDVVAIVDSIEKSYKPADTGPTINILVQNLMERFKDDV